MNEINGFSMAGNGLLVGELFGARDLWVGFGSLLRDLEAIFLVALGPKNLLSGALGPHSEVTGPKLCSQTPDPPP